MKQEKVISLYAKVTKMPLTRGPQLAPSDIKLLRLFVKVVENGGFAGAQAELNVSASTISTQMSTLETRLGIRLCERGRIGFKLTDKGRRIYTAALRLEEAIDCIRADIGELRGKLVGELHVGIVDTTTTNPDSHLHEAIRLFTARDNSVNITLHVAEPATMEKRLLEGRLHLGVSASTTMCQGFITSICFVRSTCSIAGAATDCSTFPRRP